MYQPYYPYPTNSAGLLSRIFRGGFSFSDIINGTNKTLNVINQMIPIIKQVGPTVQNAKTMFRVMNEFKKFDTPKGRNSVSNGNQKEENKLTKKEPKNNTYENVSGPTFFL